MILDAIHLESLGMASRALSLGTAMIFIGCLGVERAEAQVQNLEAGKSPSQIFAGTCSACHKSPRGLLKTVAPGSLSGFLRQHYTTSPDMANVLSSYLASNGTNDTRYGGAQPKSGKEGGKERAKDNAKDGARDGTREARSEARQEAKPEPKSDAKPDLLERFGLRPHPPRANEEASKPDSEPSQAARPDADGAQQIEEGGAPRRGRNAKRMARPADVPAEAARLGADGQIPAQAGERGPDGRKLSAKQKLSKRGKPADETTTKDRNDPFREFFREREQKAEPAGAEPAPAEPAASDTAKADSSKPDGISPTGEGASQSTRSEALRTEPFKSEPAKESDTSAARPDAVSPVAPAPAASSAPSAASSPAAGGSSDPASTQSVAGSASPPAFAVPAPPPAAPPGPPTPPISQ